MRTPYNGMNNGNYSFVYFTLGMSKYRFYTHPWEYDGEGLSEQVINEKKKLYYNYKMVCMTS